ncbi:glycosyltransferase family 39 protein [Rubripirellula reticaptiva]|uniref:Uncharacterized protein n=1 Tax=Rubripirellula reticaptiva TaxID=2528013 RepID=A0A5C6F999_9BACT|nr:glycosyltransferase family 39 protein [Rubripirellula reticaptiva]TWU57452.1 hypothetical protein Poly59_03590 [Rubripirellula reticaptiva]
MRKFVVVLLLVLIAVKTAAVLARGPVSIEMDAAGYWRLSTSVMGGDLLLMDQPIAYRTPVYPWFVATVRSVAGSQALLWIVVIQGLLWVASLWIAARLAKRITRLPLALPLTLLVSLPAVSAIVFSATLLSESLFVFALMLNLSATQSYFERETNTSAVWVGVTFALMLLTRPIVLLLWIPHVIFLGMVHLRRRSMRRPSAALGLKSYGLKMRSRVLHVLIAGGVIAAMVMPWLARNQVMFGKPFLTEFVGRNLWVVTFQDGSGAGLAIPDSVSGRSLKARLDRVGVVEGRDATWLVSDGLTRSGLSDPQADQLMKAVAIEAIKKSPRVFAAKAVRRYVNVWRTRATDLPTQGDTGQFFGQTKWQKSIPLVDGILRYRASNLLWANTGLMILIAIATLSMVVHRPTRLQGLWLAMCFGYFTVITGSFEIPAYRYRMVLEPVAALVVGAGLAIVLSKRTRAARPIS